MRFGKEKKHELIEKLLKLYTEAVVVARSRNDADMLSDESQWYKRVYEARLVAEDPEQLFLLGALAQQVFEGAPVAMVQTMELLKK